MGIRAILFTAVIEGIHIWRAALDEDGWPGPEQLPAAERRRYEAFLREQPAKRWLAARWALRRVLGDYLGAEPAAVELEVGEHGKPHLTGKTRLEFNLSHSEGLALIAVASRPVGVDVETIRPRRNLRALAERALPAEDVAALDAAPPSEQTTVFYRAWARHEAHLKCLGSGLGGAPDTSLVTVEDLDVAPGYAAAVAVAGAAAGPLRCRSLRAG
ncbi:MAG TPA: 4'-phosphopantetheinyl transferase superfamily protein [Solirubrobacterales bacterium]|nr:4'-phosphopantetheinyl transferase superfamily protein [Solirubrobacterales bacterium]